MRLRAGKLLSSDSLARVFRFSGAAGLRYLLKDQKMPIATGTSFRAALAFAGLLLAVTSRLSAEGAIEFNRDVRPILSDKCFACHGPDKGKRKGDLRLDIEKEAFAEREGRRAIVAGKLDDSELYKRIIHSSKRKKMPPEKFGKSLSQGEIDILRKWIEQGAGWQAHWSAIKPAKSDPPPGEGNPVDRFIRTRLDREQKKPASQADRRTIIRRITFDLTGLPPSPADVDAFVADKASDGEAVAQVIEKLLASEHYGERMAMYWLDLVRYADTNGIHGDNHREHALYRDYVIDSFNENKAFDEFTREQLAGDLLPDASVQARIASGYNRLLMTTREGGAQAKEYLAKYAADRVRNASGVWMASTMGCAECHDHKFDQFTMKDFYSFASFFADIKETAVGTQAATAMPSRAQLRQIAEVDSKAREVRKSLDVQTPELTEAQALWEKKALPRKKASTDWSALRPVEASSAGGATLKVLDDGSILASGANPDKDVYTLRFEAKLRGVTGLRLEVLPDASLPAKGPGRAANGNIVLNEFEVHQGGKKVSWGVVTANHSQDKYGVAGVTDGNQGTGWALLPRVGAESHAVFEASNVLISKDRKTSFTIKLHQNYGGHHTIGHFRLLATDSSPPIRAEDSGGIPVDVVTALQVKSSRRTPEQKGTISRYYRSISPVLAAARRELESLAARKKKLEKGSTKVLISTAQKPRMMRVLPRGNWLDDSGEEVKPAVPGFLNQIDTKESRATRLDLANWMISRDNPYTARVFVNRLWKLFFGRGIVKSLDDFGSQGSWPTHPALLDWLAIEFMEKGWDIKHMVRLIVSSATYRQSSLESGEDRSLDPYNALFARQGRFRLDAEMVRDNALSVSGLLVRTLGGNSVKPYQPGGYWSHLNFPKRSYKNSSGESLYRRGLYTYWCRTFLHPSLLAFDAPTREECTAERVRSNTPQQALVLLNDPVYVEAARVFAQRLLGESGTDVDKGIQWAFREALARSPSPAEAKLLKALHQRHLGEYSGDPESAKGLATVGAKPVAGDLPPAELAAWISVTRVILNLHEIITRY